MNRFILASLVTSTFALSACGGSGGSSGGTFEEFRTTFLENEATTLRVFGDEDEGIPGIPGTAWSAVPTTGTATFNGFGIAAMVVDDAADDVYLLQGDAQMVFDFGNDDITGSMSDIVAADGNQMVYAVSGEVAFSNGDIGATQPNDFTVDYAGDLGIAGTVYTLDGEMSGLLRGTRTNVTQRSPVRALSASSPETGATVTANGQTYDFAIGVIAETD